VTLFADRTPFRSWTLDAGHGHRLQVDEWGAPDGTPALLLHGGPGSGCSPLLRRFFDPVRYRVICLDQLGAGRSLPRGSTVHNTTAELLADLHLLRQRLGLPRWLVVGGSWGATLALAHALAEPQAVAALLLRALFLPRRQDIDAFFAGGPSLDMLAAGLRAGGAEARRSALAWWRHELERSGCGAGGGGSEPEGAALDALTDRYRVQAHYLLHRCWLDEPPLLQRCATLPNVPTLLLHARDDRICPHEAAVTLQAQCAHAQLQSIERGGHDPAQPEMAAAMVSALERFAAHGHFGMPTRP
jgi:proline iminopeptidase